MSNDAIWLLVGGVVGWALKAVFGPYFGSKAQNLATKEDIKEITGKIESVKLEYASQLESTKAQLSGQLKTHGFRYEQEYKILSELTRLLIEVRDASMALRPVLEFKDPDKSDDDVRIERLTRHWNGVRALYLEQQNKRPFYPADIYEALEKITAAAHAERVQYQYIQRGADESIMQWYEKAMKNQKDITEKSDAAMEAIRGRINKWEQLA